MDDGYICLGCGKMVPSLNSELHALRCASSVKKKDEKYDELNSSTSSIANYDKDMDLSLAKGWRCGACTFGNPTDSLVCEICQTPHGGSVIQQTSSPRSPFGKECSLWECCYCTYVNNFPLNCDKSNRYSSLKCAMCKESRRDVSPAAFEADSSPSSSFTAAAESERGTSDRSTSDSTNICQNLRNRSRTYSTCSPNSLYSCSNSSEESSVNEDFEVRFRREVRDSGMRRTRRTIPQRHTPAAPYLHPYPNFFPHKHNAESELNHGGCYCDSDDDEIAAVAGSDYETFDDSDVDNADIEMNIDWFEDVGYGGAVDGMDYDELLDAFGSGAPNKSVSNEVIARLPMYTYQHCCGNHKSNRECKTKGDLTSCTVCQDDFIEDEELTILPCFHAFHTDCIREWLKVSNACPICKYVISC